MKKTYSAPAIKARKIATESLMATASITTFSGDTETKIGDPTSGAKPGPESTGRAKAYNVWDYVDVDDEE